MTANSLLAVIGLGRSKEFGLSQGRQSRFIVPFYRIAALSFAVVHILLGHVSHSWLDPFFYLVFIAVYSTLIILSAMILNTNSLLRWVWLIVDLIVCLLLVLSTGGLESPFILYSLVPVVNAALYFERRTATFVALLLILGVVSGYILMLFPEMTISVLAIGYFFIYVAAVYLVTALPYVINSFVRRQMIYENTLEERRRLSREIHDGVVQTVSAFCWQTQIIEHRLSEMGIDMPELKDLQRNAEKARYESREVLELLRNYTGDGQFLPHLRDYLAHLKQDANLDYSLDITENAVRVDPAAELELLRICQEALTNTRLHAEATRINIKIDRQDGMIEVQIIDDGKGFDSMAYYRGDSRFGAHGLKVMHERAHSIGARCYVLSIPGRGTEVRLELPVNRRKTFLPHFSRRDQVKS